MKISDEALWRITFFSRGLPYYTHSLGKLAVKRAAARRSIKIETSDVDLAITECIEDVEHSIRQSYVDAVKGTKKKHLYKEVLLASALANTDSIGRFAAVDVEDPLRKITGIDYKPQQFTFHLNEFCQEARGSVLEKEGSRGTYRYRFLRPMLQPFIIFNGMKDGLVSSDTVTKFAITRQPRLSSEF